MTKIALVLAAAITAAPALALAQAPAAPSDPASRGAGAPVPQATAGVLAETQTTVPGVTVTGRKLKPCNPRDQACIDDISKEIWVRYPKQIETMCTHEQIRVMQQGFQMEQLGFDTTQVNTRLTPATQTLCDYGAKMKTQAAKTAKPGSPVESGPDMIPKP